ncbi:uncharacterized protein LOC8062109 [Sorghum bicolor]|uniref:RBR-type E3 ubiquitin transferase n=1 Tax=Sorghum bicolor TaxID=4558 RepID=C5XCV2_SORBI|nr:uncharacterized protein LOC8062109 [Sorghum bicolor]EER96742.1 hypothetical protein SORBI_3002G203500 [Sorghum bicolor]OQU89504.1 hypothetical protein SORBI_3002G203500 [Sorghum bicolor]|eukprot:XP_002460221.1 uncharacterized protein LOC8062109 [Sorghum bicolor]
MLDHLISILMDAVGVLPAKDLQVPAEEAFGFSTHSATVCVVCKLAIPSLEASWKPDSCGHAICIPCFWQYVPEMEATDGLSRCAVPSCQSLCKPETTQGMINVGHGTLISVAAINSGKGKEPLDGVLEELGQCSRGVDPVPSSDFYCAICMETVHVGELFPVPGCTHLFCVSCMSQYIAAKVENNVFSIGCPEPGCNDGVLDPEVCRDMISLQLFQRWGDALCDSALGAFGFHCPFKDCSALLVNERSPDEAVIRQTECPHCSRMFCAQCKVAWHSGVTCEDFQQLRNDEQGRDDPLLKKVVVHENKCQTSQQLRKDEQGQDDSLLMKAVHENKWQRSLRCLVATCKSLWKANRMIDVGHSTLVSTEDMDRQKQKDMDNMLQELGQCCPGGYAIASSEFYCTICMESVDVRELFPVSGCTHLFCINCVSQYITAKVEDSVLSIGCPEPGCKDGALDPEVCRDVIPLQLFQRWGAALCDSALGAFKFYCPFNDCSALLVDERRHGEAAITQAECPHCCRMFCAQCKVAWHDGVTCAEFQRLGKDERSRNDLLLRKVAERSNWQRCPKCKMYVERTEGCVYIVCRCGHRFCYLCASPMSQGIHRCSRCKRTW